MINGLRQLFELVHRLMLVFKDLVVVTVNFLLNLTYQWLVFI